MILVYDEKDALVASALNERFQTHAEEDNPTAITTDWGVYAYDDIAIAVCGVIS